MGVFTNVLSSEGDATCRTGAQSYLAHTAQCDKRVIVAGSDITLDLFVKQLF